ncbi:MAG: filamentous hemagglutinin-like protein [Proteobacteria bacterium]|nr:filamentous hemagglutinin-like protein [Pseudomonadota bacterium]
MKRPSLNHSYRLVWKEILGAYVAVPECARGRGKAGKRLIMAALLTPALSLAAPTGGTVTSGNASISQTGTVTQINQSTQKASINWQGFSIGSNETVNFNQPGSSAVTLNRVVGNEKSVIDGTLNANGQVFLINSNGMLFSKGSSVNVGGLVASTLNLSDEDFNAGNYVFKANGSTGAILNLGTITAKDGGYVALLGNDVSNQGLITATKGTVALSAGDKITLNFNGDSLLSVTLDEGTLNALVENKQAIHADGGTVILTAKAADELLGAQVNNSGIIQARSIDDLKGSITLYAHGGTANVDGTLDASAPGSGNGGFIETSGDKVNVADSASVTTQASQGSNGTWLIDPTNFTIAYGSGGQTTSSIGATTLQTALASGNVAITTSSSGSDAGDININAPIAWTTANSLSLTAAGDINANSTIGWSAGTLSLDAGKNVNVNSTLSASAAGNFAASWGTGTNSDGTPYSLYTLQRALSTYGLINLASTGTGTVTLNGNPYTVIRTAADFSKIGATGNYVLGADLSATVSTSTLSAPLGSGTAFTGVLEGFGHSVSLGYNTTTKRGFIGSGLFDTIGAGGLVRNLKTGGTITAPTSAIAYLGSIANVNKGTLLNVSSGSTLPNTLNIGSVGGMVGLNEGTIMLAINQGSPYVSDTGGGLVGTNAATGVISQSISTGYNLYTATGASASYVGGLVGVNYGEIDRSWNDMTLKLTDTTSIAGGLVGLNAGTIDQSYVSRAIRYSSVGPTLAGFVGVNTGSITNAYSTLTYDDPLYLGTTTGKWIAAFAYKNSGTIANSYATSYAYDSATHAGFVYDNTGGTTTNDYWYAGVSSTATVYDDNSTAKQLTAAQAANFASYVGFSSDVWAQSASGYPVLRNTPVYVLNGTTTTYGSALALIAIGLQGGGGAYGAVDSLGDDKNAPIYVTDSSGYIDAGGNAASSVLGSTTYSNIRGQITVAQKALTLGAGSIADKTYDGTTTASLGTVNLVGLIGNQTLTVTGLTGTFSDANAGTGKTVTVSGYTLSDGSNGGKASNYKIGSTTTTASITPKALTLNASIADKTYDGTTTATVNSASLSGIIGSDSVSLSSVSADFTDKNVGTDKSVVFSDATLSGSSAGNYTVTSAPVASTADITPRVIELTGSKIADGSTTISASQLYAKNAVAGDSVGLSGSATLASAAAGTQALSSLSGLTTSNANYTLVGTVGSVMVGAGNLVLDKVASGSATVSTSGTSTTVSQTTDKAMIDWLRFSVGRDESLNFVQPSASSIVLNRVTGNEASVIAGALNANGKVFIINSNGVLFKAGASVNVGALVASTLNISDSDFLSDNYVFISAGGSGSLVDEGSIVVVEGGFLALVSDNGVSAKGFIAAPGGTAILASAKQLTLNLDATSGSLANYSLAQLSGTTSVDGTVYLRSTSSKVATLETAGQSLSIGSNFFLSEKLSDLWSISLPTMTIGSGGDFTGDWVDGQLLKNGLALNALSGDLTLNDKITWSSDAALTLGASGDLYLNKSITATGTNAGLALNYGGDYHLLTKASYSGTVLDANGKAVADAAPEGTEYASITLSGSNASLKMNGQSYTLIHSVDQLDKLDQCASGLCYDPATGTYSKSGGSIVSYIASTKWWNANGNVWNPVTQAYDIPMSKVINGTTYNYNLDTGAYDITAAYGTTGKTFYYYYDLTTGLYSHAAYSKDAGKYWNPTTGQYDLSSSYSANIYYDIATGLYNKMGYDTATGKYYNPLTGLYDLSSKTSITSLYYDNSNGKYDLTTQPTVSGYYALAGDLDASGTVYGDSLLYNFSGTLAGLGHTISNLNISSATTSTTSTTYKGMIDIAQAGSVIRDLGLVNPVEYYKSTSTTAYVNIWAGSLVGMLYGTLSQDYVEDGSIGVATGSTGGLAAWMQNGSVSDSYTTLSGASAGLIARTYGGSVVRSHATGTAGTGGLIGTVYNGTLIANDYATGVIGATGSFSSAGGLIQQYDGTTGGSNLIKDSFATGDVYGAVPLGGLVGQASTVSIVNSYATGNINGSYPANQVTTTFGIGGLVGSGTAINISSSFATGNVTTDANVSYTGGLVGYLSGSSTTPNTITDSYALGNVVSASSVVGGLVGSADYTTINNAYAKGNVTGVNTVGGLAGAASNSTISNSYTTGLITATQAFGLNTNVGGIVGTGSFLTLTNDYYNAELNAGHVRGGYGNPGFGSYFHNASSGLDSTQMDDVTHYANGTINQVISARQEAAAQAAAAASAKAAAQQAHQAAGTQLASQDVAQHQAPAESPQKKLRADSTVSLADALDQNIVFVDKRNYAADVRRIEVDGQVFILEEDEEEHPPVAPKR